ncbi:hypothetical protein [Falsihalocynthiibacter arcticus]|uniref:hypothetical protein n=1 Tax=Falsihalocynthiibacter arcticus TaxID=1579316 RepID=UPI0009ED9E94|nr:hypothetical protein [Falsihalocynthiibacter arcticus]
MNGLSLIFALLGTASLAETANQSVAAPPLPEISCYCTDKTGSRVELGQSICLQVDGRMFTARCEMSLNNPMWREQSEGCLSSGLYQIRDPSLDTRLIYPKIFFPKS